MKKKSLSRTSKASSQTKSKTSQTAGPGPEVPGGSAVEIRFDRKAKFFLAALGLCVILSTLLNINGSSIGMWERYKTRPMPSYVLLGTPKEIRSDEWLVHTPAILSQCNSTPSFSTENYSLGAHKAPLVMNLPVRHFSVLLRPQYWLFFIAEPERAFSFYWGMKLLILTGGIFLLLMVLLENNFVLSVFGALWVYFSGYVQWWYSSPVMLPEIIGCFALFTAAFLQVIVSRRKVMIALSSVVFIISFFNFAVCLYPPYQVPLVYLSLFIIIGIVWGRCRSELPELLKNKFRLICIFASIAVTAGLLFLFYLDARSTLEAMTATVYPGQRRAAGGEFSVAQAFSGFLGIFMSQNHFPAGWINVCESSNFFLFFPIPLMLMGWRLYHERKVSVMDALFTAYVILILVWQFLGFPKAIARLTLFDRVTEVRTVLALGICSIAWTCFSLHRLLKEKELFGSTFKLSVAAVMLAAVLVHSLYFNAVTDGFASWVHILVVSAFAAGAAFLFVSRKSILFAALVLVPNIAVYGMVNPVNLGLKQILNHPVYESINKVVAREPGARWVFYGVYPFNMANFAYSTGAKVFNGFKHVPDLAQMKEFSTEQKEVEIYNRSGNISLLPKLGQQIDFKLINNDHYLISIDPANDVWKRLKINYVFMPSGAGQNGFRIYRSQTSGE